VKPYLGRVRGVALYRRDAVVLREGTGVVAEPGRRGEVTEFSEASRRRLAFVANNTEVQFRTMITLTYPKVYPNDGLLCKSHLGAFIQALRRYTRRCSYLWFLEFQVRGAPHFHILTDYPMPRKRDEVKSFRRWVAQTWYRVTGRKDPLHLIAGTRTERLRSAEGGAHYALKYASKMEQKRVPQEYRNVGRLWGASRDVKPQPYYELTCSEDAIRDALDGQPYAPRDDKPLYHVLYNKAVPLAEAWVDCETPTQGAVVDEADDLTGA
jgi:hypothetical protein